MEGIVLFNKPSGYTSQQVLDYFKQITKEKKIGHGGTLDKLAQGLLIIGIGTGTKYLRYFLTKTKKTYLAEIKFGYVSETYDREGKLIKKGNCQIDLEKIKEKLKKFQGKIKQIPPKYSAIKIKGQPAYKLVRRGIDFTLTPKEVNLYDYQIVDFYDNLLKIRLTVSSGFYVRSFANDLGEELSCGGVLWNLIREKINNFDLKQALTFKDIEKKILEVKIYVKGRVQGVGYRYFCYQSAKKLNITGYAQNLLDGRVKIIAQGYLNKLDDFIGNLKKGPILAKVDKMTIIWRRIIKQYNSFKIL